MPIISQSKTKYLISGLLLASLTCIVFGAVLFSFKKYPSAVLEAYDKVGGSTNKLDEYKVEKELELKMLLISVGNLDIVFGLVMACLAQDIYVTLKKMNKEAEKTEEISDDSMNVIE